MPKSVGVQNVTALATYHIAIGEAGEHLGSDGYKRNGDSFQFRFGVSIRL